MEENTYKYISFRQKMEFDDIKNNEEETLTSRDTRWSLLGYVEENEEI